MPLAAQRTKDVQIEEDIHFNALISNPYLLQGLISSGYERPSPIQLKAIPLGRLGLNLIAQAKSGTGKTVVFGVIALESLEARDSSPQVIILAPTREIAVQINTVICAIGRYIVGVKCEVFIGGLGKSWDLRRLQQCQIIVGTPGRVQSLIATKKLSVQNIKLLVLDEADKLMEEVFTPQVKYIIESLPPSRQILAFSATYDDALLSLLDKYIPNPQYIMLTSGTPSLEGVHQHYKLIKPTTHDQALSLINRKYAIYDEKFVAIIELLSKVSFYQCIVFLNHRGRALDLTNYLTKRGYPSAHIAGGIDQKQRLEAMDHARNFKVRVLVCSDLIARGIDIERVNLVVNMDLPRDPETYLHRVGRTGRFGTSGLAVSFVDEEEAASIQVLRGEYAVPITELTDDILANLSSMQRDLADEDQEALISFEKILKNTQKDEVKSIDHITSLTKNFTENINLHPKSKAQFSIQKPQIAQSLPSNPSQFAGPWHLNALSIWPAEPHPWRTLSTGMAAHLRGRNDADFIPPDLPF